MGQLVDVGEIDINNDDIVPACLREWVWHTSLRLKVQQVYAMNFFVHMLGIFFELLKL